MSANQIKAVIFDLDGTLVDSYEAIYLGFQYAYEQMGLKPLSYDEVKVQVGHSLQRMFSELLGEERVPQAIKLFRKRYEEVFRDHTHLLPDAREALTELHQRGIKLSVATNKLGKFSRAILENLQVGNLFSAVIGEGDPAHNIGITNSADGLNRGIYQPVQALNKPYVRGKPDPQMLYLAIEKMGLPKEQTVLVGDSEIDIQSAHNAGIRVYAIPTGTTGKAELARHNPTAILDNLKGLLQYI
ncbi:MAG: HAD-IA family hydrolase [Planctomycetota bacterium]